MLQRPTTGISDDVDDLVRRWREEHDYRARDKLVRLYLPVIKSSARRWGQAYGINVDDAQQEATLGFMRAIETHDASIGPLENYSRAWMRARIGRARPSEMSVKISVNAFNDTGKVARAAKQLQRRLGRHATDEEIASEVGLSLSQVKAASAALFMRDRVVSMNTPIAGDNDNLTLGDMLEADDAERPDVLAEEASKAAAARAAIDSVVASFTPRHREYFELRFGKGLTGEECGAVMGFNRQRAAQIEKKVVGRLREALVDHPAVRDLLRLEQAAMNVDDDDSSPLLGTGDVEVRTGLTREVVMEMVGRGEFPRPAAKDRRGHRLWRESMVERWRAQHEARPPVAAG